MMPLQRHTLCWLESSALDAIAARLESTFSKLPAELRRQVRECLLSGSLPGIVRRGERHEGLTPLGFCFPLRWQERRLRLATEVASSAITRTSTPEQTASLSVAGRTDAIRAFNVLAQGWCWPEIQLGVWGSVALEIVTPWQWTDAHSDLDIRLVPSSLMGLNECWASICNIERQFQLRIDGEMCLSDGYAINIKEWFSGSSTLLAKSENDVQLISRQQIAAAIRTFFR
ncbi:Phosphoribosyl-dephospho-CoA transferase [Klebsiella huaxiensis]|uniref:malonate decarboxylase holo-[acyl-carrier-protein] synthase n=1 Tax=Klebsiella huaxiensis TaxID=2153354 RepID=UPI0011582136|nr:malonate decarboxylase holo-[acyl-carrier-protein] synthase [Klebsiella huaxiensis]VUT22471.1 Phosphoribosyl-dephospho-CoA transferase [Klebsiella huaxiensis]